jgi:peptidoglycan/LPS O-acetylase OafA/YrhL
MPDARGRIHELDALRGLAALGVVVWHYGIHFHAQPLHALLMPLYTAGFLLVDFFFVLSGYVIARAYWKVARQGRPLANVYARIARLYPLHLLTLLATALLLVALPAQGGDPVFVQPGNDARHFLLNLVLLNQSGLQSGWSFNTPAWSISAEFLVNIAFFGVIALAPRRRLGVTAVAVVFLALLAATATPPYLVGSMAFGYLDANLIRCAMGFALGVGVYWLVHRTAAGAWRDTRPILATLVALAGLGGIAVVMLQSQRHPPVRDYLLSMLTSAAAVIATPASPVVRSLLRVRPLVFLGDISYSIYLVHYPLQLALYTVAARGVLLPRYEHPVMLVAFLALVVAVAALTHRFVELPGQRLLLGFARREPAPLSSQSG